MIRAEDNPLKPLPLSFYRRDTETVARKLLGCQLVRRFPDGSEKSVVIVETEAYLGVADRAAHTWNGRKTPRVAPMWGPGGHAYVYFVYGMHHCLNVVTKDEGEPEAVLIRAGVPKEMWTEKKEKEFLVASGPAKLCSYLGITTSLSGASLAGPELFLVPPSKDFGLLRDPLLVGPRVGVAYAGEAARWPLRFAVAGCPAVTRPAGLRAL
jgi:DNA-3-methyladenine glycosylase